MFSLIQGYYKSISQPPQFNILIIGVDGSGKTLLLQRLKQIAKQEYLPEDKITKTIGLNIANVKYLQPKGLFTSSYEITYWDLGGSQTCRNIWKKYYLECHAIIYVFCTSKPLQPQLDCFYDFLHDPTHDQVPILVLINQFTNEEKPIDIDLQYMQQVRWISIQHVDVKNNNNIINNIKLLHSEINKLHQLYK